MQKSFTLFLMPFLFLFLACGNADTDTTQQTDPAVQPPAPTFAAYPILPEETVANLINNADYVDFIYYELPLSMNMSDPAGVRSAIQQISTTPALKNPACKSIGRVIFQKQGETLIEADMYFQPGCYHYVFLQDGKPTYGNVITETGVTFFKRAFAQAQAAGAQ